MFKHLHMIWFLGLDIGGTHISGALVDRDRGTILEASRRRCKVDAGADSEGILEQWVAAIRSILDTLPEGTLGGLGIAMPGPFDYARGISLIRGLDKYDGLYGVNVGAALREALGLPQELPIVFANDATCFALGEYWQGAGRGAARLVAITLGTGLGAAFLDAGKPRSHGPDVPEGGTLYQLPYGEGIAEDRFSARGLLAAYAAAGGDQLSSARLIHERAMGGETLARDTFFTFGRALGEFMAPWLKAFSADQLILGGRITEASAFFMPALEKALEEALPDRLPVLHSAALGENAAILGAAGLLREGDLGRRRTKQPLRPVRRTKSPAGYTPYPAHPIGKGRIQVGEDSLAQWIIHHPTVLIDGYAGVDWDALQARLGASFREKGLRVQWVDTRDWLWPADKITALVAPFLGAPEAIWGRKFSGSLADFFDPVRIREAVPDPQADIRIVMGIGAALSSWEGALIYLDLPKNELQYRMRAGAAAPMGSQAETETAMYKRFYFVDWEVLNAHKKALLDRIDLYGDAQVPGALAWMQAEDLRQALAEMAGNVFRARPWFEPGAWGGQWMKQHLAGINREEVNYAWSFELITPENGLLLESDGCLLELSFDLLMFAQGSRVLGEAYQAIYGDAFPIRFDFLDTVKGGNLSIQCHPSVDYIGSHFGEPFTQDETYYILDAEEGAGVYLGFQENIDPDGFREDLEASHRDKIPVKIDRYVQHFPASRGDLFLIPHGTVHSAGAGNLVLEISATPYIYTFKMYDWLRPDLQGNLRPINLQHAFANLNFSRQGGTVADELISRPRLLESGEGWALWHLPTHPAHFYDVHRLEFQGSIEQRTNCGVQVLMLVEGEAVRIETAAGMRRQYSYAETFVVPAAAGSYRLTQVGERPLKIVKAFLKPLS